MRGSETEIHTEGSILVRKDDGSLSLTKSVGPAQLSGSVSASARMQSRFLIWAWLGKGRGLAVLGMLHEYLCRLLYYL